MKWRLLTYLGVGLVLLIGLGVTVMLEPYDEVIDHGPAPETRGNPYLAAEQFLRRTGRPISRSEHLADLDELPAAGHSLLLLGDRGRLTSQQTQRLLDWAARGGHLLFVAERLWNEADGRSGDLLADRLNLQQYASESHNNKDDPHGESAANEEHPQLTKLYLENETSPAYLAFDTDFHLYDADNRAHAWANSAGATHMLQLRHGDGLITAMTDAWIWQNDRIGEYDHAWLLWYLTQDSSVTLVYRNDHPGLSSLLLKHFPEVLAALLLLALLGAWHFGQRHGPLQTPADHTRRRLHEHLLASAEFTQRQAGREHLLAQLQQEIAQRAGRHQADFNLLDGEEQRRLLGLLSGLPAPVINQAMRPPARLSAIDFTRQVADLQTLRNAL
ncbi:DUF4350 domain-containing protein [Stutzerimonas stutzeri]|uniref:DUF4350 domain-containing protein n=1 Tax=Stutzerimonas sp. S1 TaxID=3030652 RepID=UPI0022254E28|nr:DUF4350 domain-containing protein [Stutzerimonas sp. S1]MCW3149944.1 DUF4350 domain-containing protein [Stutzerimonas sp. S1]